MKGRTSLARVAGDTTVDEASAKAYLIQGLATQSLTTSFGDANQRNVAHPFRGSYD